MTLHEERLDQHAGTVRQQTAARPPLSSFPSSPLSRSALRGDTGLEIRGKGSYYQRQHQLPRHASNPARASDLLADPEDVGLKSAGSSLLTMQARRASQPASSSGAPPSTVTTPPLRSRHFGAWSPDLAAVDAYLATSPTPDHPHPYYHPYHSSRSPPVGLARSPTSGRRRFSGHGFGASPTPNFGSLIGSYEESLLSGRMSALPSKPLIFDAELGVLGLGKCRPSLRCPPHLNLKFPAHFYSLEGAASASGKEGKVSPGTPYVGTIDLESHYLDELLASQFDDDTAVISEPPSTSTSTSSSLQQPMDIVPFGGGDSPSSGGSHPMRPSPRNNRSSQRRGEEMIGSKAGIQVEAETCSTKVPTFPGYRIPSKGQIQLVIKNPNHTAVKLFLVPYDLTDMPAGTKTFIRQKSHAAVLMPGMDTGLPSRAPDAPPPSPSPSSAGTPTKLSAKETLRYAVHLQFCALPSGPAKPAAARKPEAGFEGLDVPIEARTTRRARTTKSTDGLFAETDKETAGQFGAAQQQQAPKIYLHKSIRVCFAARLPDKSEKLSVVTDTPGGANGNVSVSKDHMYSSYSGPGEEWKEAKRAAKFKERAREIQQRQRERQTREARAHHLGHDEAHSNNQDAFGDVSMADDDIIASSAADLSITNEADVSGDLSAAATEEDIFMFNSDPNGERWEEPRSQRSTPISVGLPRTTQNGFHPTSWATQHEQVGAQGSISATADETDVDASRSALGRLSLQHQQQPQHLPQSMPRRTSNLHGHLIRRAEEHQSSDDDRALLDSWHQNLALRPQSSSSSSHSSSSLQHFQARPPSPPGSMLSLSSSNRPMSSSSSSNGFTSMAGESSVSAPGSRPLSPTRLPTSRRPTSPPSMMPLAAISGSRLPPASPHRATRAYTTSTSSLTPPFGPIAGAPGAAEVNEGSRASSITSSTVKPTSSSTTAGAGTTAPPRPTLMRRLSSQTALNAVSAMTATVMAEGASMGSHSGGSSDAGVSLVATARPKMARSAGSSGGNSEGSADSAQMKE